MTRPNRTRSIAATVLVVLGGIALVLAATGWWLERNFVDTARFTGTATEILGETAVQNELTAVLVRQLSREAGTDLRIAQPFLASIVGRVVESTQFRDVFDEALSAAHAVLVDRGTRDVVLDLTGAYQLVKGPLETIAPDLAADLPSRRELEVTLLQRSQLTFAWDLIDRVQRAVTVLAGSAVVLLAAGIALAQARLRALSRAAWTVVATSGVVVVAVLVGRFVVKRQFADGVLADAVAAALRVITTPLLWQTALLAAIAVLIGFVARALERTAAPSAREAARDAWQWARGAVPAGMEPPTWTRLHLPAPRVPTRSAHVARASLLTALGVAAVLEPGLVGRAVVLLTGIGVLVLAVTEALAARRVPAGTTSTRRRKAPAG